MMYYYAFSWNQMARRWDSSEKWLLAQHACNYIEIEKPRAYWYGIFTSTGELVGGSILDWTTAHDAMCLGYVTGSGTAKAPGRTPGFSGTAPVPTTPPPPPPPAPLPKPPPPPPEAKIIIGAAIVLGVTAWLLWRRP